MTSQWKRLALAVALAASVGGAAQAKVVVGSKLDTEATLLGNMILLALEANGIETEDRITLGGTPVVRKAITAGEIDIYPEYTGNAAFFFNKADDPLWKDHAQGYEAAKQLDYDANKIVWLTPAPANNTWAIALRQDVAEPEQLVTMSDFGRWVAGGGKVVLAGSAEFVNSAGALPSFQQTYGFTMKPEQLIVLSGGDTSATIKAAAEQTNGTMPPWSTARTAPSPPRGSWSWKTTRASSRSTPRRRSSARRCCRRIPRSPRSSPPSSRAWMRRPCRS